MYLLYKYLVINITVIQNNWSEVKSPYSGIEYLVQGSLAKFKWMIEDRYTSTTNIKTATALEQNLFLKNAK